MKLDGCEALWALRAVGGLDEEKLAWRNQLARQKQRVPCAGVVDSIRLRTRKAE